MSGKNFIQPYAVIVAGDMSADIISAITDTIKMDNICYQAVWSGAALVGKFQVEVTDDDVHNLNVTPTWTALTLDSSATVPANSGDGIFNINQNPGRYIRFHYVHTSGTGTLDVKLSAKGLG